MMINPKKLIKFARKWQRVAALRRKRISLPGLNTSSSSTAPVADKGHFVVYTADQRRFVLPISYLSNQIFQELLRMSEEEFGLPSNGPITLPCDAVFIDYEQQLVATDMIISISFSTSLAAAPLSINKTVLHRSRMHHMAM
ncbi:hypothetical protein Q3G72_019960 [Acer saccharum]|nr:hypothetical protein Q3G72_030146 [Acer saccharum]KAK1592126.1 hypothetical protein Q3G72_019960 [Acer saccharum]